MCLKMHFSSVVVATCYWWSHNSQLSRNHHLVFHLLEKLPACLYVSCIFVFAEHGPMQSYSTQVGLDFSFFLTRTRTKRTRLYHWHKRCCSYCCCCLYFQVVYNAMCSLYAGFKEAGGHQNSLCFLAVSTEPLRLYKQFLMCTSTTISLWLTEGEYSDLLKT